MEPDSSRRPSFPRDNDIDEGGGVAPQSQQLGARSVTEERTVATREHRRQELALARELLVTRGVHAAVLAKQRAACHALAHHAGAHPDRTELIDPNQCVLAIRVPRDPQIHRG